MRFKLLPATAFLTFVFLSAVFLSYFVIAAPLSESEVGTITSTFPGGVNTLPTSTVSAQTTTAAASSSSSSSGSGGGGGTGSESVSSSSTTTTTTPKTTTPTTPGVPVKTVSEPVTTTVDKSTIIQGIKPADLGITEVTAEKIEATKVGIAETTATVTAEKIDTVLQTATGEAKTVLQEIKSSISSGSSASASVQAKLEVYQVKSTETGKQVYVSKISLSFTADKDAKKVEIVEVIPKSVAASINEIIFTGEKPKILQADPIVQWEFADVKQGDKKDLTYLVSKKLDTLNTTTVAVSTPVPAPVKPAVSNEVIIGIVIVIIVAGLIIVMKKRGISFGRRQAYRYGR